MTPKQIARLCIEWFHSSCVGLFPAFYHYLEHHQYDVTAAMAEEAWSLLHAWHNDEISTSALYN